METIYKSGDTISDRYHIKEQLGIGGSGITYAAKDLKTDRMVAIKVLSLDRLDNWKKVELFEREAKILQQLNYPGIPQYLDYFSIETKDNYSFYIVQELARGQSLQTLVTNGWRGNLQTIIKIAEQILDILVYLQQLAPPVIHRDLKPHNIIYQPDTGKLFLVDFGAVQDTYHHTVMGSTIVGTYGYMSPEQFRGGAILSTDLYSLGCTILFLLTGESPSELPEQNLKINFRDAVKVKRDFARWLDKLIEPNIRDRFNNAEEALKALRGEKIKNKSYLKSSYTDISIKKWHGKLIINIPPVITHKQHSQNFYLFAGWFILLSALIFTYGYSTGGYYVYGIGWIYIILVCLRVLAFDFLALLIYLVQMIILVLAALTTFISFQESPGVFSIFSFLPIVLFLDTCFAIHSQHKLIREMLFPTRIECDRNGIIVKRLGYRDFKSKGRPTILEVQQFTEIEYIFFISQEEPKYQFGGLLTPSEREWLTAEISNYLLSLKSSFYDDDDGDFITLKSSYYSNNYD